MQKLTATQLSQLLYTHLFKLNIPFHYSSPLKKLVCPPFTQFNLIIKEVHLLVSFSDEIYKFFTL